MSDGFRSGFAVICGRPNVGKSTLLNRLVGEKIAIVSTKAQTTRNKITGVLTRPGLQIVFLDTPGIHKPKHRLGEYMVEVARRTLEEVDVVLFVVDGSAPPGAGDRYVADAIARTRTPTVVAVNKADLLHGDEVEESVEAYSALAREAGLNQGRTPDGTVLPVSAVSGLNIERLTEIVAGMMPEGPMYYPEDMVTDQPEQFLAREIIREKILELTREEVPHSVAVVVEEMTRRSDDLVYIGATVYVEKESQKGIIIGEGGRLLKEVGRLARLDLEGLLGMRVYLELWVKVKAGWRNREPALRAFGYGLEE